MSVTDRIAKRIFLRVCRTGNLSELEEIIDEGHFDPDCFIDDGINGPRPAMIIACEKNIDVMRLLLEKGADVDVRNGPDYIHTPLHGAAELNDPERFALLFQYGADPTLNDHMDNSVLSHYIDCNGLFVTRKPEDTHKQIIRQILVHGSRIQATTDVQRVYRNYFSLCKAIFDGSINDVEYIIHCVDDVRFTSIREFPPVFFAVAMQRYVILRMLLEHGAELEETALWGCTNDDVRVMEACFAKGFSKEYREPTTGETPLHWAAKSNSLRVAKLLVMKYNFAIDTANNAGQTPLFLSLHSFSWEYPVLKFFMTHFKIFFRSDNSCEWDDSLKFAQKGAWSCESYVVALEHGATPIEKGQNGTHFPHHRCWIDFEHYKENCPVIQHMKKLQLLDPAFGKDMISRVLRYTIDDNYNGHLAEYRDELKNIKRFQICGSTTESPSQFLYDFLFFDPFLAARFSKNQNMIDVYAANDEDFGVAYEHFGFALNYQFWRASKRRFLLESIRQFLAATTEVGEEMPDLIFEEIFKFFSDKTLESFINVLKN